ncbi:MAG: hypothetical protein KKC30_00320 [Proteobacteria bacterium]|nr:hypothetical protein [Pseudomonadota bacterium]MBU4275161.1 hypothetical protein [Pseudomonadota bacterium]MBU4383077.1 hypothetical protein [Pseudomonadota bacterium]MBU4605172.1 hypothetical protein [Pseudomonadota bacterium]MCG2762819.1 hypothetical protein [Desulfarculaceae bacterium]
MTCSSQREAQLLAKGWVKQFMADEPRLSEMVEEYIALGFQVRLEPVDPAACASGSGCTACFEMPEVAAKFKIIFTRPGPDKPGKDEGF